ncbi:DUF4982 domain-containing protein [Mycoplasma nasistruthionis]|nr:DUF4982 domain-containing protein [Mycoplasma nasistruthionis]
MVHILPHWTWDQKKYKDLITDSNGNIEVRVFSNASKVELFLDDKSLGEKEFVEKTTNYGYKYQEGAILKSYI